MLLLLLMFPLCSFAENYTYSVDVNDSGQYTVDRYTGPFKTLKDCRDAAHENMIDRYEPASMDHKLVGVIYRYHIHRCQKD